MAKVGTTRYYSDIQEKRLAKAIGGKQVKGSGAVDFNKGDVLTSNMFIEAKTKMKPCDSIKVNKEWFEKAREQALIMRKLDYAVAISFGDNRDYYCVDASLFVECYRSRDTLNAIVEAIGQDITLYDSEDIIKVKNILKEER